MYCIKCGVELSQGQDICPLCNTRVYHPDLTVEGAPTYPKKPFQSEEFNRRGLLFVITVLSLLPLILPMIFELSWHGEINWSGYVTGGVLLAYLLCVLPLWFKKYSPAIFLPCDFAAILVFLLYVDLNTGGVSWFLPFALPVTGALGLIVTAVGTVAHYLRRGRLYIIGGGLIAVGLWTVLIEGLIALTFGVYSPVQWSLFSCLTMFILGMMLIVIAIVKPFRDSLYKIFFIGHG
ncbi:MAG: hypothetical protein IJ012_03115 [Clostridia bacterium]|nr:hypothetical protein [Clostridia bacterium]